MIEESFTTKRPNWLLFSIRFLALLFFCIGGLSFLGLTSLLPKAKQKNIHKPFFQFMAKVCCYLCGYTIRIHGKLPEKPGLIIPNHVSYGDILVLASVFPTSFVGKIQIKAWPLIGWISTLAGTIYVTRLKERQLLQVNEDIKSRLAAGRNVVIFLEGKTSSGEDVLPFRSPLLDSVIGQDIPIIPVALKWHTTNPNVNIKEHIAYWRDEHTLLTHLIGHLGHTGKVVECTIGEAVSGTKWVCRKEMAASMHMVVKKQFHEAAKKISQM